jgi:hypothetical protein
VTPIQQLKQVLGLIKHIFPCLLVFTISACSVTKQYYLPVDESLRVQGTICGTVPWGRTDVPLTENIKLSVSAGPENGHISAHLQLSIPTGVAIRFRRPELVFIDEVSGTEYVAPISTWKVGIYGNADKPGYFEFVEPDALLKGKGRNAAMASKDEPYLGKDLFSASAVSQAPALELITMGLPNIEVNGIVVPPVQIPLYFIKARGTMTCVQ